MKNKFIRVISPLQLGLIIALLVFSVSLFVISIIRFRSDFYGISFLIISAIMIIISLLTVKEVLSNGVIFRENEFEFTGLDIDNTYDYSQIKKTAVHKDVSASLKMNFVERYSSIILYLKDGSVATLELGTTTKKTLKKIEEEINKRSG